jgi:anti-sigma regulatory factor (Ser/Thr protein kinase)
MSSDHDDLYWLLNQGHLAARQARDLAWEALARLGLEADLIDDAVTIVSELVANAVVHGAPPVELQLRPTSQWVKVLVIDHGAGRPAGRTADLESPDGRGLQVVSAYSSGHWGTMTSTGYRSIDNLTGRAVWAGIPRRPNCFDDLEPRSAAALLQRWLTRRGVREVVSALDGAIPVVSLGQACAIRCLPGKLVWRDKDTDHLFACQELPDVVESLCQRAAAAGRQLSSVSGQ